MAHLLHQPQQQLSSSPSTTAGGECCGVGFLGGGLSTTSSSSSSKIGNDSFLFGGSNRINKIPSPSSVKSSSSTKSTSYSADASDVALAKEMNELSFQERERVYEDIHGVAETPEETPGFIAKCLEQFDKEITKIPVKKRKALDRALFLKPSIQSDTAFKLMFLRADLYDPVKASRRLSKHFHAKLQLFGEERLVKKITLDDLEEEGRRRLNKVGCILLPNKDSADRPIWFFDFTRFDFDPDNHLIQLRCFWYNVMTTVEDETAQLKGVSNVAYCPGDLLAMPARLGKVSNAMKRAGEIQEGFPTRITTFQFCYNDERVRYLVSTLGSRLGKQVRLRLRTHFGSDLEMQYSLMTYGISSCQFYMRGDGGSHDSSSSEEKYTTSDSDGATTKSSSTSNPYYDAKIGEFQQQFIQKRREIERLEEEARIEQEQRSGIILHPQPLDVLVGRGRPYQEYPGNQRLGLFVERHIDRVKNAKERYQKTCIFLEVVKAIKDTGGRFIQKTPEGWWQVTSDKVAREKTCSAFRSKMGKAGGGKGANNNLPVNGGGSGGGGNVAFDNDPSSEEMTMCSDPTSKTSTTERDSKRMKYDPSVHM